MEKMTPEQKAEIQRKADAIRQELHEIRLIRAETKAIKSGAKAMPEPAHPLGEYGDPRLWPTDPTYGRLPREILDARIAGKPTPDLDWGAPFRRDHTETTPIFTYTPPGEEGK